VVSWFGRNWRGEQDKRAMGDDVEVVHLDGVGRGVCAGSAPAIPRSVESQHSES
jgi:hypothetical protein